MPTGTNGRIFLLRTLPDCHVRTPPFLPLLPPAHHLTGTHAKARLPRSLMRMARARYTPGASSLLVNSSTWQEGGGAGGEGGGG